MRSYLLASVRVLPSSARLMTGSFLSSLSIFHARLRIGPGAGDRQQWEGAEGRGPARRWGAAGGSRRSVKSLKKTKEYRYAGEVKQNRNETVKRRFDGTPIKARGGRRENLFVRNSSSSSVPLDYRRSLPEPSLGKMPDPLKRELRTRRGDG